jgi:hypothetical protein
LYVGVHGRQTGLFRICSSSADILNLDTGPVANPLFQNTGYLFQSDSLGNNFTVTRSSHFTISPSNNSISLADFYGLSASYWTSYIMGFASNGSRGTPVGIPVTDQFNGNIITPGSDNSPVTFTIVLQNEINETEMTLSLYVGGSINQTWSKSNTGTTTYSHTSTFGGSSLQFRSSITDYDDFGSNDSP